MSDDATTLSAATSAGGDPAADSTAETQAPGDETIAPPDDRPTRKVSTRLSARGSSGDLERTSALGRLRGDEERRYDVREEIGRGAMGRILRVEDGDLNREVAMKVLLGGQDHDKALRFMEEAQINSQLEHPNVLSVHDLGIDANGDLFFTMQLIPRHETLRDIISRLGEGDSHAHEAYSFERRVQIVQQVCHALHYAHERGVVHRDVKPENIVVGRHGEVWLVDWGVACVAGGPCGRETGEKVKVATTSDGQGSALAPLESGAWVGTPRYMAPEQILGLNDEVDARTDLYSLTAVLYELLTLHHYLGDRGQRLADLVEAVPNDAVRDAESYKGSLNGRVPRHLSRFCRKGLRKAKEDRWQSAFELNEALQSWIEGEAPVVCPGTAIQRSLKRAIKLIDGFPVLLPALIITFGILAIAWVVYASVHTLGG